ncbi:MAG: hypothetical protein GEEBNDBF_01905 [bacterium]|nr:hypothetical protein [bacterium]
MTEHLDRLKDLLAELFQFDHADLDFGLYRILNAKREEVTRFLNETLLGQVADAFASYESQDRAALEHELEAARKQAEELGVDPDTTPRVKELRAKMADVPDRAALESAVYSHLYTFFRRYYHEGDFLTLRRYKEGVYAIPYAGEEVKLHWANHDQYYIKTSEHFRDYCFTVADGRRVHFKLVSGDTERDNNRAQNGKDRRFVFVGQGESGDSALVLQFAYRQPDGKKSKQAELNAEAAQRVLALPGISAWVAELTEPRPTDKSPSRTLLEKHLAEYTARNTFDYFIHKDLAGFLKRELDFFIKAEVMHLDDIEHDTAPRVEQYLAQIKVLRALAHQIIAFLAQIEDFQKKLWLKKKFVVDTQWCVTLDRLLRIEDAAERDWLLAEIIANDAQREEWVRLFAIDNLAGDLTTPGYAAPLTADFLRSHPTLVVDTRHYAIEFRDRLLATFADIDAETDGVLLHSENFQALRLLQARYEGALACIHIDPPYNTQTSGFLYRNDYQHSNWLGMMGDRLQLGWQLLAPEGNLLCHIDENENERLHLLCDYLGLSNAGTVIWDKRNPMLGRAGIATQHEYVLWRTPNDDPVYLRNVNQRMILEKAAEIIQQSNGVSEEARRKFASWVGSCLDLSGGEKAYRFLEHDGRVYRGVAMGAPEPRTDPKFHEPLIHPMTGQPCPVPPNGWSRTPQSLRELLAHDELMFGPDHTSQPQRKVYLTKDSQRQVPSLVQEAGSGKADLDKLGLDFPYCHPVGLYIHLMGAACPKKAVALDYFAGSGTNGHAVISLNREDGGSRKFVLVEVGEQFRTVLLERIKKVTYTPEWKDGKPKRLPTAEEIERSPHFIKVLRLESYEDTLNNLALHRSPAQQTLLDRNDALAHEYRLHYLLDVETRDSASLLNIAQFATPFDYRLDIATDSVGETVPTVVDLVETFNYLLGLRVQTMRTVEGVRVVTGSTLDGQRVCVLWRTVAEVDNAKLRGWFTRHLLDRADDFDLIYVNGDNTLASLRLPNCQWTVQLTEEAFHRLMFEGVE